MKNLFSVVAVLLVACIALVSPPVKRAAADPPATDAGAPPAPSDCATCIQCVAGCTEPEIHAALDREPTEAAGTAETKSDHAV